MEVWVKSPAWQRSGYGQAAPGAPHSDRGVRRDWLSEERAAPHPVRPQATYGEAETLVCEARPSDGQGGSRGTDNEEFTSSRQRDDEYQSHTQHPEGPEDLPFTMTPSRHYHRHEEDTTEFRSGISNSDFPPEHPGSSPGPIGGATQTSSSEKTGIGFHHTAITESVIRSSGSPSGDLYKQDDHEESDDEDEYDLDGEEDLEGEYHLEEDHPEYSWHKEYNDGARALEASSSSVDWKQPDIHLFKTSSYKGSVTSEKSSRLDPHTYQSYAAGLLYSSGRSEKFLKLQKHFAILERIGELDKAPGTHPQTSPEECSSKWDELNSSGFPLGQDFQSKEELQELYSELKEAKKKKEFYHDMEKTEQLQWSPQKDFGLKRRERTLRDQVRLYRDLVDEGTTTRLPASSPDKHDQIKRAVSFGALYEKFGSSSMSQQEKKPAELSPGRHIYEHKEPTELHQHIHEHSGTELTGFDSGNRKREANQQRLHENKAAFSVEPERKVGQQKYPRQEVDSGGWSDSCGHSSPHLSGGGEQWHYKSPKMYSGEPSSIDVGSESQPEGVPPHNESHFKPEEPPSSHFEDVFYSEEKLSIKSSGDWPPAKDPSQTCRSPDFPETPPQRSSNASMRESATSSKVKPETASSKQPLVVSEDSAHLNPRRVLSTKQAESSSTSQRESKFSSKDWSAHTSLGESKSGPREVTLSYLQLMDNAAKKSRQRAIHGTHLDPPRNDYEVYVEEVKKMTKDEADANNLHIRSISAPHSALKPPSFGTLPRSQSSKESFFGAQEPTSSPETRTSGAVKKSGNKLDYSPEVVVDSSTGPKPGLHVKFGPVELNDSDELTTPPVPTLQQTVQSSVKMEIDNPSPSGVRTGIPKDSGRDPADSSDTTDSEIRPVRQRYSEMPDIIQIERHHDRGRKTVAQDLDTHSRKIVPQDLDTDSHSRKTVAQDFDSHSFKAVAQDLDTHSRKIVPQDLDTHSHNRKTVAQEDLDIHSRKSVAQDLDTHSHSRKTVAQNFDSHSFKTVAQEDLDTHSRKTVAQDFDSHSRKTVAQDLNLDTHIHSRKTVAQDLDAHNSRPPNPSKCDPLNAPQPSLPQYSGVREEGKWIDSIYHENRSSTHIPVEVRPSNPHEKGPAVFHVTNLRNLGANNEFSPSKLSWMKTSPAGRDDRSLGQRVGDPPTQTPELHRSAVGQRNIPLLAPYSHSEADPRRYGSSAPEAEARKTPWIEHVAPTYRQVTIPVETSTNTFTMERKIPPAVPPKKPSSLGFKPTLSQSGPSLATRIRGAESRPRPAESTKHAFEKPLPPTRGAQGWADFPHNKNDREPEFGRIADKSVKHAEIVFVNAPTQNKGSPRWTDFPHRRMDPESEAGGAAAAAVRRPGDGNDSHSPSHDKQYGQLRKWTAVADIYRDVEKSWSPTREARPFPPDNNSSISSTDTFIVKETDEEDSEQEMESSGASVSHLREIFERRQRMNKSRSEPDLSVDSSDEPTRPRSAKSQTGLHTLGHGERPPHSGQSGVPRTVSGDLADLRHRYGNSRVPESDVRPGAQAGQTSPTDVALKAWVEYTGRSRYDPYLPPEDILKEVSAAATGRKLDVPRKMNHKPSNVSKMTLQYFDQIGSEWQRSSIRGSVPSRPQPGPPVRQPAVEQRNVGSDTPPAQPGLQPDDRRSLSHQYVNEQTAFSTDYAQTDDLKLKQSQWAGAAHFAGGSHHDQPQHQPQSQHQHQPHRAPGSQSTGSGPGGVTGRGGPRSASFLGAGDQGSSGHHARTPAPRPRSQPPERPTARPRSYPPPSHATLQTDDAQTPAPRNVPDQNRRPVHGAGADPQVHRSPGGGTLWHHSSRPVPPEPARLPPLSPRSPQRLPQARGPTRQHLHSKSSDSEQSSGDYGGVYCVSTGSVWYGEEAEEGNPSVTHSLELCCRSVRLLLFCRSSMF